MGTQQPDIAGIEPATFRLTAGCSTSELYAIVQLPLKLSLLAYMPRPHITLKVSEHTLLDRLELPAGSFQQSFSFSVRRSAYSHISHGATGHRGKVWTRTKILLSLFLGAHRCSAN